MSREFQPQRSNDIVERKYVQLRNWDWELTKWSQRFLSTCVVGSVTSGVLVVVGIASGNRTALEAGLYGASISLPAAGVMHIKETIEAKVRRENNLYPPTK